MSERMTAEREAEIRKWYPDDEVVGLLLRELDAVRAERDEWEKRGIESTIRYEDLIADWKGEAKYASAAADEYRAKVNTLTRDLDEAHVLLGKAIRELDAVRGELKESKEQERSANKWARRNEDHASHLDAQVRTLTRERDEARKDSARVEWLDDEAHWLRLRPGRNMIGLATGGWLWTRGRIGEGPEEKAFDIRAAIDAAREVYP